MKEQETKSLSKEEKFVCEMIWGGVPVDVAWVRNIDILPRLKDVGFWF